MLRSPIDSKPNNEGGRFGAQRPSEKNPNGRHAGVDFSLTEAEAGKEVRAILKGKVVSSFEHKHTFRDAVDKKTGKKVKKFVGGYGFVVIIDHTLDDRGKIFDSELKLTDAEGNRVEPKPVLPYTYTLYAHLREQVVHKGAIVKEGKVIGYADRTGTIEKYKADNRTRGKHNRGYHLHFEVSQFKNEIKWGNGPRTNVPGKVHRVNPLAFLMRPFPLTKEFHEPSPPDLMKLDQYPKYAPETPPKPEPILRELTPFPYTRYAQRGNSGGNIGRGGGSNRA